MRITEDGQSLHTCSAANNFDAFDFGEFCEEIYCELQKYENFMEQNEISDLNELTKMLKELEKLKKPKTVRVKKTFLTEVRGYIKFYQDKQQMIAGRFITDSEEIINAVKYGVVTLNTLSNRYLKENKNQNNYQFMKHIDVMKGNLKDTDFESLQEVIEEILDDLQFLKNKYI